MMPTWPLINREWLPGEFWVDQNVWRPGCLLGLAVCLWNIGIISGARATNCFFVVLWWVVIKAGGSRISVIMTLRGHMMFACCCGCWIQRLHVRSAESVLLLALTLVSVEWAVAIQWYYYWGAVVWQVVVKAGGYYVIKHHIILMG